MRRVLGEAAVLKRGMVGGFFAAYVRRASGAVWPGRDLALIGGGRPG